MSNIFRTEIWSGLRDILFPMSCLACGAVLKGGCVIAYCCTCLQNVRFIQEPFCRTCGMPFVKCAGASHLCGTCLGQRWHFARARAIVEYGAQIAEPLKEFKYNGKMHALATFNSLAHIYYQYHCLPAPDLVLPVPLHPRRLRQRGFNQALVLSRKLFPAWKKIIDPFVLERHRWTRPQAGLKGEERRNNVKNVFRVKNTARTRDKKILLVDDVFTTGATVNECSRVLLESGATEVEVFTFARSIN